MHSRVITIRSQVVFLEKAGVLQAIQVFQYRLYNKNYRVPRDY